MKQCGAPCPGMGMWRCELEPFHQGPHYSQRATTRPPTTYPIHWPRVEEPLPSLESRIAEAFHESYERLAPEFGWKTQERSAVPWERLNWNQRALMCAVIGELLDNETISA